jgi:hypothetical protein
MIDYGQETFLAEKMSQKDRSKESERWPPQAEKS